MAFAINVFACVAVYVIVVIYVSKPTELGWIMFKTSLKVLVLYHNDLTDPLYFYTDLVLNKAELQVIVKRQISFNYAVLCAKI